MAGYQDSLEARVVVSNWMSNRYTLEFLGIWEQVNHPNFNRMELGSFVIAPFGICLTSMCYYIMWEQYSSKTSGLQMSEW